MKKIDEYYIALAIAWLIICFAATILAGLTADQSYDLASTFALSTAFAVAAFAGLVFRFFPLMKLSKLAKPQFAILNAGLAMIVAGGFFAGLGFEADLMKFGVMIAFTGVALFAFIFWRERASAA